MSAGTIFTVMHIVMVLLTVAMLLTDLGHPIVRAVAAIYLLVEAWLEAYQS